MSEIICPCCGEKTFSNWKKLNIGTARKIYCKKCNARVTVPTWKLALFCIYSQIAGIAGVIALLNVFSGPHSFTAFAFLFIFGYLLGTAPAAIFYVQTTPLIKKGT